MELPPLITPIIERSLVFLPKLITALVIFLVGLYLSGLAGRAVKRTLNARDTDPELTLLLQRVAKWTIIILVTITALQRVDFNLTGFVAGLGIIGFTIGFALQDVSKNFVAGILLLLQQPFDIGDAIEVAGYSGTVKNVDIRATEIRTFDGLQVLIPNGDVYVNAIKNFSKAKRRRLQLNIGVAYDSDLDIVTDTVSTALSSISGVITDDPAPAVAFKEFGDSSINLTAYFWIDLDQTGYLNAQDQSIKVVKKAFEATGIDMPFPMRTLQMPDNIQITTR